MPYNNRPPFVAGSETSEEAAKSIDAGSIRDRVRALIEDMGCLGSTDEELERKLSMRHQTVSARRRELVLMGMVKDSGVKRRTTSGRKAVVWIACDEPSQEAHKALKGCPLCGGSGKVRDPYPLGAQPDLFGAENETT
jgi:hypothetical protein